MTFIPQYAGGSRRRRLAVALASASLLWGATQPPAHAESPDDPWYATTYRLQEIWEQTRGEGITVAVIDTGVDDSLPELEGQLLEGTDVTLEEVGPHTDRTGHGSGVASLIAGTGAEGGVQGLAPEAEILPIRADDSREGVVVYVYDPLARAITRAVEEGAQIINMSLGTEADDDWPSDSHELEDAVEMAARAGVLIFAATGNEGEAANEPREPASLPGVVGIGAVDSNGERAGYSTYGPQVAFSAPGDDVPWRCPPLTGPTCLRPEGGTSSATAIASASAALIWSAHPDWTKNQVLRVMVETAERSDDQVRDDYTGHGMIRPDRVLLDGEGDPGDPDVNPLFSRYERSLDPPPSAAPTAPETTPDDDTGAGSGDQDDPAREAGDGEPAEPAFPEASDGGGGAGPIVLFGLAGAVLVGGVTAAVLLRRRAAADIHSK